MEAYNYGEIVLNIEGPVAEIKINRPDKLNALNLVTIRKIETALNLIEQRDDIRVVTFKGAGNKAFVAGADIEAFQKMTAIGFHRYITEIMKMGQHIASMPQPVLAVVDGFCLGGGCTITLACDMVFATKRSKFSVPETSLGFTGNGSSLVRLVGKQVASEMTMLGTTISAQEAKDLHLVNRLAENGEDLDIMVTDVVKTLCKRAPAAMQWTKRTIRRALDSGLNDSIDYEADASVICFQTDECKDAIDRFVNRGR